MTRVVGRRFGWYSAFVADGLVAAGTAAVVAITCGAHLRLQFLGVTLRANNQWRWLVVVGLIGAARIAITWHMTRHVSAGFAVREGLVRILTLGTFATMAAATLTALDTSCGGLDSAGYVGAADLLVHGHLTEYVPVARLLPFVPATPAAAPLGWIPASQPFHIAPEFPLGLPMVMALAQLLFGRTAPFFVAPMLAAAAVALTYALARRTWDAPTAVLGASLVAASPIFVNMAIQPMSDIPSVFWLLVAAVGAWRQEPRPVLWGIAGGMAMLTRPPLLLAALVVAATGRWNLRQSFVGGVVFSAFLVAFVAAQWHMYGHPFTSGHGNASQLFNVASVPHNVVAQAKWLLVTHTPLMILTFVLGAYRRQGEAVRALLIFLAVALPYAFYSVRFDDWEMTRFLLPGLVFVLIICAAGVVWLVRSSPDWAPLWSAVVAACVAVSSLAFLSKHGVFDLWQQELKYPLVASWVKENTPKTTVAIASLHSGSLKYYTGDPTLRIEAIPPMALVRTVQALERSGLSPYAVLEAGPEISLLLAQVHPDTSPSVSLTPVARIRGTLIIRLTTSSAPD